MWVRTWSRRFHGSGRTTVTPITVKPAARRIATTATAAPVPSAKTAVRVVTSTNPVASSASSSPLRLSGRFGSIGTRRPFSTSVVLRPPVQPVAVDAGARVPSATAAASATGSVSATRPKVAGGLFRSPFLSKGLVGGTVMRPSWRATVQPFGAAARWFATSTLPSLAPSGVSELSAGVVAQRRSLAFAPTTSITELSGNDSKPILTDSFLKPFEKTPPPFGFNGLGQLVYRRTYSRVKPDGTNEEWWETVARVVNGTYNLQRRFVISNATYWDPDKGRRSAEEMYRRIFSMKMLPPGRGLWAMGSVLTEERGLYAALNNCAFISTQDMHKDPSQPFTFLMDVSMLGVGCGFDTRGAGTIVVKGPNLMASKLVYVIPDTREGWVESVKLLLDSYFYGTAPYTFDPKLVRPAGRPIRGFGGVSSGPGVLLELHDNLRKCLDKNIGRPITERTIVDIQNYIGKCVVAGNVRRTAEIAFGSADSLEYLNLKNYKVNPDRADYGWTSNNSVFAEVGMDYKPICDRIRLNGEPGLAWLDNMKRFGRMNGKPHHPMHPESKGMADPRVVGGNPCLEQSLEHGELCTLGECVVSRHDSIEDFQQTLKSLYLYTKTITLTRTHIPLSNAVMMRNRRIGLSVTGVANFVAKNGLPEFERWCNVGYDTIRRYDRLYSGWFGVPESLKCTSVKPSGTISLLAGVCPGMHWPESRFYIRRVRLAKNSELLPALQEANYHVEPAVGSEKDTVVVEVPVDVGPGIRTAKEVSMWEQLQMTAFLQKHWADNQVSATITFDPKTEGPQLEAALSYFQTQLKGVSFLPRTEKGAYAQMPYEAIDEATYKKMASKLKPLHFARALVKDAPVPEKGCNNEGCDLPAAGVVPVPDPSPSTASSHATAA